MKWQATIVNQNFRASAVDLMYISDVRELIQVDDAMEDESLRFGPNGGLIFCME